MDIRQQLVPAARRPARTYLGTNRQLFITVHETGNRNKGANAAAHANLQSRGNDRRASWHIQVDDREAVQSFPFTAQCWHSGKGRDAGNLHSIAIEICVNSDGDFRKAVENAAAVIRRLMAEKNIPIENVVQHNHWSGKNCPQNLRNGSQGITWADLIAMVRDGAPAPSKPTPAPKPKPKDEPKASTSVADMATAVIRGDHGNGHANRRKSLGVSAATYAKVRAEVNRRLSGGSSPAPAKPKKEAAPAKSISAMATEVIRGDHGNGHTARRKSLGVTKAVYEQVRAEVNKRAGVRTPATRKPSKSITAMATEVLRGDHGNGHDRRRKSLGVSAATYAKVRAEVNRRA